MSVVYLIAQPTIAKGGKLPNLEPLCEHGEIKVLVQSGEYPTFNPQACYELIQRRLKEFNPDTDFLAWAGGDTLAAVLTGVVLADQGHERVKWLRYERGRDPKDHKRRVDEGSYYVPIDVFMPEPSEGDGRKSGPVNTRDSRDPAQRHLFHSHDGAPHG